MDKAKQAVSSFLSHDGKHRTTVDEDVRHAVTEEHIKPHQHEEVTTAIDKEVHQHHHHTTVQPIVAKEVLPEQHHHNMAPVVNKEFHHGNEQDVRATLERDAARYKDSTVTHEATRSVGNAPVISGERVHHHVHEHVQPVINKEVVQPHVVHTTVPIHETHHLEAVHHGTSVLPTKTLQEFAGSAKNALEGRNVTQLSEYEGCPKPYKKEMQQETLEGDRHMHLHSHDDGHHHGAGAGVAGVGAGAGVAGLAHKHRNRRGSASSSSSSSSDEEKRRTRGTRSSRTTGTTGTTGGGLVSGLTGGRNDKTGQYGNTTSTSGLGSGSGLTGSHQTNPNHSNTGATGTGNTAAQKPSLLDRLNPMKDTDHDGKKGFLD